jgi:hypothetical protein
VLFLLSLCRHRCSHKKEEDGGGKEDVFAHKVL